MLKVSKGLAIVVAGGAPVLAVQMDDILCAADLMNQVADQKNQIETLRATVEKQIQLQQGLTNRVQILEAKVSMNTTRFQLQQGLIDFWKFCHQMQIATQRVWELMLKRMSLEVHAYERIARLNVNSNVQPAATRISSDQSFSSASSNPPSKKRKTVTATATMTTKEVATVAEKDKTGPAFLELMKTVTTSKTTGGKPTLIADFPHETLTQ